MYVLNTGRMKPQYWRWLDNHKMVAARELTRTGETGITQSRPTCTQCLNIGVNLTLNLTLHLNFKLKGTVALHSGGHCSWQA